MKPKKGARRRKITVADVDRGEQELDPELPSAAGCAVS